jgi:hypothetical protein
MQRGLKLAPFGTDQNGTNLSQKSTRSSSRRTTARKQEVEQRKEQLPNRGIQATSALEGTGCRGPTYRPTPG